MMQFYSLYFYTSFSDIKRISSFKSHLEPTFDAIGIDDVFTVTYETHILGEII